MPLARSVSEEVVTMQFDTEGLLRPILLLLPAAQLILSVITRQLLMDMLVLASDHPTMPPLPSRFGAWMLPTNAEFRTLQPRLPTAQMPPMVPSPL